MSCSLLCVFTAMMMMCQLMFLSGTVIHSYNLVGRLDNKTIKSTSRNFLYL